VLYALVRIVQVRRREAERRMLPQRHTATLPQATAAAEPLSWRSDRDCCARRAAVRTVQIWEFLHSMMTMEPVRDPY